MTWPAGAWLTAVATSAHNFSKAPRIWATKSCADSWGCVSIAAVTPQVRKCATASSAVPALLRTLSPSRMICHTPGRWPSAPTVACFLGSRHQKRGGVTVYEGGGVTVYGHPCKATNCSVLHQVPRITRTSHGDQALQ